MIYLISPFESEFLTRGTRSIVIARKLINAGYKVTFVTSNFNHERKKCFDVTEMVDAFDNVEYDFEIIKVPAYKKNISIARVFTHIYFSIKLFFLLNNRIKEGDMIITMLSFPELTVVDYLLAKRMKIRIILDIWDIWPDAFPFKNRVVGKLFSIYCNMIYRLTLHAYDHLVYVAPSFDKWINRYTANPNRTFVPLGYDHDRWSVSESDQQDNELNLVYVGYLSYQFDIRHILNCVNKIDNLIFHIIGDGEVFEDLRKISSTERNIFYGRCSASRVVEILSNANVAILPISSTSTAFMPNKLFDYLGAGLPILSLGNNDSSEFVVKNKIGWSMNYDLHEIRNFLNSLDNTEVKLKAKNTKIVRSSFAKENLYQDFVDIAFQLHQS